MTLTASPHLRGIVIAGVLAAVAVALGFVTLAMNQPSSSAATHPVLSLKARHLQSAHTTTPTATPQAKPKVKPKPVKRVPVDKNLLAALHAGLPRSVAKALAAHRVAVVSLTSNDDSVAEMAMHESQAGAQLAGASFVPVSVDRDGGDASALTLLLGQLPAAPATLVYIRPGTLFVSMPGFNDRTTVQQAAANAAHAPAGTTSAPATPTSTTPATTTPPAPTAIPAA